MSICVLRPVGEGHSTVTFLLSTVPVVDRVGLRRPPPAPLPPSAHDVFVLLEARLMEALESTPVRSPKVLAWCDDMG